MPFLYMTANIASILCKAFGYDLKGSSILNIHNFSILECVCDPDKTHLCNFLLLTVVSSAADEKCFVCDSWVLCT